MLDRHVQKFLDIGEGYDLVELTEDLSLFHPKNRAIQKNVLPATQLGMKAGPYLEQ